MLWGEAEKSIARVDGEEQGRSCGVRREEYHGGYAVGVGKAVGEGSIVEFVQGSIEA